jgi:DNA-binding beta-propeller fold protein YncE
VWVAPDDFVFVAEYRNNRVQVLTPTLDFHAFVGVGQLDGPSGVCADDDVVVVSEWRPSLTVFRRRDGVLLRRFGSAGSADGQLQGPLGVCFMSRHRHVAVADGRNDRVSVFSVEGEFVRHVGADILRRPHGVACSAFDELVVADRAEKRVVVFGPGGGVFKTMGYDAHFLGIAIHGATVFAQDRGGGMRDRGGVSKCVVFE